jgi:hypothetical protein
MSLLLLNLFYDIASGSFRRDESTVCVRCAVFMERERI